MTLRFFAVLLMVCALTAPVRAAAVKDRLQHVAADGTLTFAQTGPARLQGIVIQPEAVAWLEAQREKPVWLRQRGTDRYGRAEIVALESTKRNAASWQEQLLRRGLALTYDRAVLPKKWGKAESLPASVPADQAQAHIGTFVLLHGRITRSYKGRDYWYFNFGDDWRTDPSLRIPRRAWRAFGKDFTLPPGSDVIARGALFLDNGPMLELTRPEQLQLRPKPPTSTKKATYANTR